MDWQIVIPMSGLGSRFKAAGYPDVKPLIPVQGRPIIEWVLSMFQGEEDVHFICRDEHLESTPMRSVLERLAPTGQIHEIEGHKKGPVYALSKISGLLDPERPVLVSYCDYYMQWDYEGFKKEFLARGADGAVPCYTGFHPHLVPEINLYAGCRVDADENLLEIREKFSFTEDKTKSYHSPGVYVFKDGATLEHYANKMLQDGEVLGGEYYASLIYPLMLTDNKTIWAPANVEHFCQWGTPRDLQEYEFWTDMIRSWKK